MLSNLQYLYLLIFLGIVAFIIIYSPKKKQLITKGGYHMTNGGKKNVLFIFGAGISSASCPRSGEAISTDTITKEIFTKKLKLHTDQSFYCAEENKLSPFVDEVIHPLLRLIRCKFIKNLGYEENQVTYEDIFYFMIFLEREIGYPKNPLLKSAVDQFADEAHLTLKAENNNSDYEFLRMLRLAQKYIKTVVMLSLCKLREPKGYEWLSDAMQDEECKCNIVTLNHDLLLDKFFKKGKTDYCDGFEVSLEDKAKIFNPRCFLDISKPHLIKLHGSIDWEEYKEGGQHLVARRLNGFERT